MHSFRFADILLNMKYIDYENWDRREQNDLFKDLGIPFFSVTLTVDVTDLYLRCKREGLSFYNAMIFVVSKSANSVPAFLDKLRDGFVVQHDYLSPSYTYPRGGELFGICNVEWKPDETINEFCTRCKQSEKLASEGSALPSEDDEQRDDMLYLSCTPWFSFTHVTQEMSLDPNDSIPRILWGKYTEQNGRKTLPISIQVNHRLIDGIHIAKWLKAMENIIAQ